MFDKLESFLVSWVKVSLLLVLFWIILITLFHGCRNRDGDDSRGPKG